MTTNKKISQKSRFFSLLGYIGQVFMKMDHCVVGELSARLRREISLTFPISFLFHGSENLPIIVGTAADTLPCNGFSTSKSGGLWHLVSSILLLQHDKRHGPNRVSEALKEQSPKHFLEEWYNVWLNKKHCIAEGLG